VALHFQSIVQNAIKPYFSSFWVVLEALWGVLWGAVLGVLYGVGAAGALRFLLIAH